MTIKNKDFVELDFIARVKETGAVFDTTILQEAEKAGLGGKEEKEKFKPTKICVGQGMVLQGLDKALENKEIGKWYEVELLPHEAFGERDSKLVKIIPLKAFRDKGVEPAAGMMLNLDNLLVRIAAVSSGRVIADFNNPLSGKSILYKFKINRKIDDKKEGLEILTEFFLGKPEKVDIENGKGVVEFKIKVPDSIKEEFSKRVKEILGLDIEIRVKEEKSELKEEATGEKTKKQKISKSKEKLKEDLQAGEEEKIMPERPYNE
jgi:FKBP-type peptidyl-prolyl cis-trans isomerase 2